MTDVLVVGAGMTGLACGHTLAEAGVDVTVVDAAPSAGGVVGTTEREGFRFEDGPSTIQASAKTFRRLCGALDIADELVTSRPEARRRYLFYRGRLRALPGGPLGLIGTQLLSPAAKLKLVTEPLRRAHVTDDGPEPTFEEFLTERIGRSATRTLAGAFVRGVYAAEVDELGARSAFPRLWSLVRDHGSLLRGAIAAGRARRAEPEQLPGPEVRGSTLLSFPGGLARFVDAFAASLGPRLRLNTPVTGLARHGERWSVAVSGAADLQANAVVLALPAPATRRLLETVAPDELDLAPLRDLAHADVTVVHLGLERDALPDGFGFLVPPDESGPGAPRALGVLFPSKIFEGRAPAGAASISAVYRTADLGGSVGDELVELVREDLARALGHEPPAATVSITQTWANVIPRYGVGHAERMTALAERAGVALPGLTLAGTYRDGVSVDDCLARGVRVGRELAEQRRKSPEGAA